MITEYFNTLIRCERGAKAELNKMAAARGGFSARAERFVCIECHAEWDATDFSGALEPDTVTCSNCYGSKVVVWQVRIQIIEAKDLK